MQSTDFAPVLSATSSRDSVWIISNIPNLHQLKAASGTPPSYQSVLGPPTRISNHFETQAFGQITTPQLGEQPFDYHNFHRLCQCPIRLCGVGMTAPGLFDWSARGQIWFSSVCLVGNVAMIDPQGTSA